MKYRSVFEIIGPVMIGPSSSHTAGAARIGLVARQLFLSQPDHVTFRLYGSFAKTYQGHGTDVALLGGILGFDTSDQRLTNAFTEAEDADLTYEFIEENEVSRHPNTVKIEMKKADKEMSLVGISIGGGKVEITELNGFELGLSGNHPAILVVHHDRYGAIASVASVLAEKKINIGHMEVSRKEEGKEALMVIEVDQNVYESTLEEISKLEHITQVTKVHE
ncbi:L-serine ammonia-lyase, iron-sulfur-dependent subunit beta [Alkalicoccus daliensis]|uniref:L-serine deaminase n=1 Tax=Alkalicoccus daliensis TaxID=745820 RepID=A0A1H0A015_9BACI|nr:L-serine ammonia-lyase, iron-sulfur-dependent subunit beta [Alkalicoccus daliensis]SDN26654.1 L-serine ammonia-lyase [Alkalicoccus daliensis]